MYKLRVALSILGIQVGLATIGKFTDEDDAKKAQDFINIIDKFDSQKGNHKFDFTIGVPKPVNLTIGISIFLDPIPGVMAITAAASEPDTLELITEEEPAATH
jgi:hypothetical protein